MDINVNPVYHDDVLCHAAVIHLTKRKSRFVYQEEFSRYTEDGEEATPTAGCGVFGRVLDHKLYVGGGPGYERLGAAKDLVIFFGWDVSPGESRDDCSVRKGQLPFTVGLDRDIVP